MVIDSERQESQVNVQHSTVLHLALHISRIRIEITAHYFSEVKNKSTYQ